MLLAEMECHFLNSVIISVEVSETKNNVFITQNKYFISREAVGPL